MLFLTVFLTNCNYIYSDIFSLYDYVKSVWAPITPIKCFNSYHSYIDIKDYWLNWHNRWRTLTQKDINHSTFWAIQTIWRDNDSEIFNMDLIVKNQRDGYIYESWENPYINHLLFRNDLSHDYYIIKQSCSFPFLSCSDFSKYSVDYYIITTLYE